MADRSLSFFVTIANKRNNPDSKTGMSSTNYDVQYNLNKYNKEDPLKGGTTENKTVTYKVVNSQQAEGQFINYQGNSTTNDFKPYENKPEHESDIKLSSIIDWTQQNHDAMRLNVFHFAYLKDFGVYPANRLMILRRFNGPVPDDIFTTKSKPINTMASYYKLDPSPVTITFSEDWKQFDSTFMDVLQDVIGIKFDSIPGVNQVMDVASGSPLSQDIFNKIGQKLGIISEGGMPYGDPNIIYQASIRNASGEDDIKGGATGLKSDVKIKFETTYVMREIGGVDAKAAMLDIIANAIHMGTSNSRFYITGNAASTLSRIMKDMETGNVDGLFKEIIDGLTEIISGITQKIVDAGKGIVDAAQEGGADGAIQAVLGDLKSIGSALLKQRYTRYKWQLRGAVSALSGMYTAPWHITIGNPKFPWFSCGNLVVENVELQAGGELGYNDMFSELTVSITLKAGRALGADELTGLFNNGRGRIYDTPDAVQSLAIPQDQSAKLPGTEATGSQNVKQDQGVSDAPTASDPANDVPETTDHSLDNKDSDNNLPSTKEDSKKGYTYNVKKNGPKKHVEVENSENEVLYVGKESYNATEQELINEAKAAVGDT
jgi:hypothetical protein